MSAPHAPRLPQDESVLLRLQSEWREVVVRHAAAAVAGWTDQIGQMVAEQDALRAAGRWMRGRHDYLGVLGLHRHEVWHSRMIAWLLDPCGHHGLGSKALEALLRRVFGAEVSCRVAPGLMRAAASCEEARDGGRCDIIVRAPGVTLVVENKVDALEGHRQCDDYFEAFAQEPGALFAFLTPSGRPPVSASGAAAQAFAPIGYRVIRDVLRAALASGEPSARGRHIAEDYLCTLDREFP